MTVYARAPLRISFAGGGTDTEAYSSRYGGLALSAAIARYVTVTAEVGSDICLSYPQDETDPLYLATLSRARADPGGTMVGLVSRLDVPPRSGLGASGALGVAALGCMKRLMSSFYTLASIAEEAYRFETREMGNAAGRQDQYAAAFGGINLMTFEGEKTTVARQDLERETILALESSLVLVYLHPRQGASGLIMAEENDRVLRGDLEILDALRHQKVLAVEMARALRSGDLVLLGRMLHEAWETKKRQSPWVTNDIIDAVYSLARKAGARGGKLAGAGGGGYMFFLAPGKEGPVAEALRGVGLRPENVVIEFQGLQVW